MQINAYILLLVLLCLSGCHRDDFLDRNVVSNRDDTPFEELLILMNVSIAENKYLVVKSIDSVKIFVNGKHWSTTSSLPLDIDKVKKQTEGNKYYISRKLNYLVKSKQVTTAKPDYSTAGGVASYLNSLLELKPGDYACRIESFQVTFNDNTKQKYYPFVFKTFTLKANMRSVAVGEFNLKLE